MFGLCKMSYLYATKCDPKKEYDSYKLIPRGNNTYCVSYESPKRICFFDFDTIKDMVVSIRYAAINDTAIKDQLAIDVINTSWFGYSTHTVDTGIGKATIHRFANIDGSEIFEVFVYPLEIEDNNGLECLDNIADSLMQLGMFNKGNAINSMSLESQGYCVITKDPRDDGFDCQSTSLVNNVEIRVYLSKDEPDNAICYMMFTSPSIPGFRVKFKLTDINSVGDRFIRTKKSTYMRDTGRTPMDVVELKKSTLIISSHEDFNFDNNVKCVGVDMAADASDKKVLDRYPGVVITSYVDKKVVAIHRFDKCRIGKAKIGSLLTVKLLTADKMEKSIKIDYDYKDIIKTDRGFNIWLNEPGNRFVQVYERVLEDEEEE